MIDLKHLFDLKHFSRISSDPSRSAASPALAAPLRLVLGACLLGLSLFSGRVLANIYGFVDAQGVSHFATEPVDARYKLFLRGDPSRSPDAAPAGPGSPALLRHLSQHPNLKKFEPLIQRAGDEFAIDPALIKAIMAAESGFRPDAVSPKGAVGLMQVMPSTAESYGLQADAQQTLEEKLTDPGTNIRLGARYLRDLNKLFSHDQDLVLAAYNAGQGAVRQYNNSIPPYPETLNYVQVVTQFLHLYRATPARTKRGPTVFTRSAAGGQRIYMSLPGRRDVPASPPAR
ncbi:MAG: lytic transglycosylase domain-containing protein [Candidatus Accumulibacter sp. UW20]|jgi:soluble lytic murein transglycosylase-like protein